MHSLNSFMIAFSLFLALPSYAHKETKYFGPEYEQLTGTVKYLTFPGRPNYTSIREGDEAERHPYLILDNVIDVKTRPLNRDKVIAEYDYDDENDIRVVQLIVTNPSDFKLIKDGRRITVKGDMIGALSGHHHAKILISIKELILESKKQGIPRGKMQKLINQSIRDCYIESSPFVYELIEMPYDDFSSLNYFGSDMPGSIAPYIR